MSERKSKGRKRAALSTGVLVLVGSLIWTLTSQAETAPGSAKERATADDVRNAATVVDSWNALARTSTDAALELLDVEAPSLGIVNRLRQIGDPLAIPKLEQAYRKSGSADDRLMIASALVSLRADDPTYFNLLKTQAESVFMDAPPFPVLVDEAGELAPNLAYSEWVEQSGVPQADLQRRVMREDPARILALGMAADPRAIPILLKGLESPNPMVAAFAARGLARLQERSAIPHIVRSAESRPRLAGEPIAQWLYFFEDADATAAANRLIADPELRAVYEAYAAEKGYERVFE